MKNLFVANLRFRTTESELTALFKGFGQVTRVHVAMDRETGRARGFAFVEIPNDEEAAKAIAGLDGKELGGRALKVNEARPKTERTAPRSSGGGGRSPGGFSNEDYREAPASHVNLIGSPKRSGGGIVSLHSDSKETQWPLRLLKRQKEMKRLGKQPEKVERRAQKKLASRTQNEPPAEDISSADNEASRANIAAPSESGPHN